MIESNRPDPGHIAGPFGTWEKIDSAGWYLNRDSEISNTLFMDCTRSRVWILYSLLDAMQS
ncbi:MAG TPA: hypothetical protein PKL29_08550, partial [Methanothrix sp.]|nr:hypothetical protein [Methanothrix sp.]